MSTAEIMSNLPRSARLTTLGTGSRCVLKKSAEALAMPE
jgi:hypothetical protein